jgi:RNA polymerase sigma factor (sigma-70 family)
MNRQHGPVSSALRPDDQPDAELIEAAVAVRRFVASRISDPDDIDDVVQETLSRTLAARSRLGETTSVGYSITVARHLVIGLHRDAEALRRRAPMLAERPEPVMAETTPEAVVLAEEDRRAVRSALSGLPDEQYRALLAHDVEGVPLTDVAGPRRAPAAVAAQLARTRARLRVDYVLALRGIALPTSQCRTVLMSLASGDKRRQESSGAGGHLMRCSTCADVAPVLLTRERSRAGVVPWLALGSAHGALTRLVRAHPWASGGTAASVAVATGAVVVALTTSGSSSPPPAPPPPPSASSSVARPDPIPGLVGGSAHVIGTAAGIRPLVGERFAARRTPVQSVPADEGFWVGTGIGNRLWVQMRSHGESAVTVRAGRTVTFTGRLVANGPHFVTRLHLPAAQAAQLRAEGAHIEVAATDVSVQN